MWSRQQILSLIFVIKKYNLNFSSFHISIHYYLFLVCLLSMQDCLNHQTVDLLLVTLIWAWSQDVTRIQPRRLPWLPANGQRWHVRLFVATLMQRVRVSVCSLSKVSSLPRWPLGSPLQLTTQADWLWLICKAWAQHHKDNTRDVLLML